MYFDLEDIDLKSDLVQNIAICYSLVQRMLFSKCQQFYIDTFRVINKWA